LVTWTIPAAINWCLRPYALLGTRVVTPGGCQIVYVEHTDCRQLNGFFNVQNNVSEKWWHPTLHAGMGDTGTDVGMLQEAFGITPNGGGGCTAVERSCPIA
jgi:hypothetical protein